MALQRLGNTQQAQEMLQAAREIMERLPLPLFAGRGVGWHDILIWQRRTTERHDPFQRRHHARSDRRLEI